MRSPSAFVAVALAFASSSELVAASNCKPSSPAGAKTTDPASITSGTSTKSAPPSETTGGPVIITNAVTNGDFGGYDPSSDGGIYAFQAGGNAKLLQGPGYQGDHTEERNCVQLKTDSGTPGQKRDFISDNPYIQQQLDNLEPSDFTVRFWYSIVNNAITDTCRIEGLYGNVQFGATPYFPVVAKGNNWLEFVDSMPVTTTSGMIRFELNCINGGSAEVYFDQVFVSNKIGDEWVDGISFTAPAVDTATTSSDTTESSGLPTTQASQAQITSDEASATDKTIEFTSASASAPTSAPTDTVSSPKLCAKLGTGAAGRGCAKRPYSSTKGYKGYGGSKITKEQCAALCLADTNCQSFEWRYFGSGCANTCNLLATSWADIPTNGGSDSAWAYDRSCIQEDECAEQPAGAVCVNVNADTPAKSCTQVKGKAKACAKPFLTAPTNGVCGLSNECRDLCAKYPSCKSYAATFGSCSLYDARSSEVAEAGSELFWFTDMDCHTCGQGNAYFDYISVGQDPASMPQWTCATEEKTTSTIAAPTTTNQAVTTTSDAETATSTSQASDEADSSTVIPATTSTSPSTTASLCANGVPSPGICSTANVVPSTATCGKRGWPRNVEPYARSLADFPNQNTFEDCALICKLDRSCKVFAIGPTRSGMRCMFSSDPTIDGVSNAPGVWSDLECVSCTLCDDAVTSSQPLPDAPTTMITSTRPAGEETSTQAATSASDKPTTTQITPEPTDCAVPSASLSDDVTCGIPGQSGQQAQSARLLNYVIKPVGSLANCAAVCLQRVDCQGFAYIKSNTECYPFRVGPASLGITYIPQGTEKYYDRGCFSCTS
ncbi:hypothetical protein H9Q69_007898 [Fusarium xylarioides]|nr:hypothetical protein H9Q70_008141 [Fusarium xylarioides]KAG5781793.1 hypothetical protein H9Q73_004562 [Fusarium xylarioides]KAG5793058.1 hypothetical protein H9Q69_007898 [Fusarium xylarioides]KAG5816202.1 hypothetical protein H9Q71_002470 [Fusarium xylarioides]KAG5825757.1 hypothetical protein H9Q74_004169 [Fusarium xylarioides]